MTARAQPLGRLPSTAQRKGQSHLHAQPLALADHECLGESLLAPRRDDCLRAAHDVPSLCAHRSSDLRPPRNQPSRRRATLPTPARTPTTTTPSSRRLDFAEAKAGIAHAPGSTAVALAESPSSSWLTAPPSVS